MGKIGVQEERGEDECIVDRDSVVVSVSGT